VASYDAVDDPRRNLVAQLVDLANDPTATEETWDLMRRRCVEGDERWQRDHPFAPEDQANKLVDLYMKIREPNFAQQESN